MRNKRIFTFGCSFTNFFWPTWADILGKEFDQFENWGKNGAGNSFIFYSLIECIKRNNINEDDTVVIMWSSIDRVDRWINGQWRLEGGVYNGQPEYDRNFIENFADPTGFLIRDLALISATRRVLDSCGCKWHMLSMVPLNYQDKSFAYESQDYKLNSRVIDIYLDDLALVKPSIFETVFNKDWYSRQGYVDLESLKTEYMQFSGSDWPDVRDFVSQNFRAVSSNIVNEIVDKLKLDKRRIRTDTHPIPLEHLEYLDKVLPEITISDTTRQWVDETNVRVLALDPKYANNFRGTWRSKNPIRRF